MKFKNDEFYTVVNQLIESKMDRKRLLVTPEEPRELLPSVRDTRELEEEILECVKALQRREHVESECIVSLLNRSLTAMAHWSLQAQLSQLSQTTDREVVETKLLRKENELLRKRDTPLRTPPSPRVKKRLVENKKPHPRMRRTGDNPSKNSYVRVFHLQQD